MDRVVGTRNISVNESDTPPLDHCTY